MGVLTTWHDNLLGPVRELVNRNSNACSGVAEIAPAFGRG